MFRPHARSGKCAARAQPGRRKRAGFFDGFAQRGTIRAFGNAAMQFFMHARMHETVCVGLSGESIHALGQCSATRRARRVWRVRRTGGRPALPVLPAPRSALRRRPWWECARGFPRAAGFRAGLRIPGAGMPPIPAGNSCPDRRRSCGAKSPGRWQCLRAGCAPGYRRRPRPRGSNAGESVFMPNTPE